MKVHSRVGLITNSSTEIFCIETDLPIGEFSARIQEIYASASTLPFPFNIREVVGGYEFDAGYYWGFYGTIFDTLEDYDDEAERTRFVNKLDKEFPGWSCYEVG